MERLLRLQRLAAASIGGTAWLAVALQCYLNIDNGLQGNGAVLSNLANFFSFFTIETNIIVALVLTCSLRERAHPFFTNPSVKAALVVYIIIVGAVYSYLLSHLYTLQGWQVFTNALLHDVIPILYPLYWLLFMEKGFLQWRDPLRWLIFPLAFFIYSMVRGELFGVYPYPFIDVAMIGYVAVACNAAFLAAAFLALGIILTALDRALAGRRQPAVQPSWQNR
jgi:hypothetical protein